MTQAANRPDARLGEGGRACSARDESGFTVIELATVMLIIAILIAIAVPTYAQARRRTNDRAIQSHLRHALAAEKIFYTGFLRYADDSAGEMTEIEPALTYVVGLTPAGTRRVWLQVIGEVVYISGKSVSGLCFYIVDDPLVGTGYARDASCGPADTQTFLANGW